MIEVRDLTKTFVVHRKDPGLMGSIRGLFRRDKLEKHAVERATFRIGEGEIVGLIGANGAGKTTLVKMLAGIIHPTGGEARVLGYVPWERDNRLRSQIALIMGQKAQLWWDLPAADCFLLLREIYRIPEDRYERTLGELIDILGVRGQLNVQIRRLSLGERMKMELIAALLHSPRVVFLDEPTIGLDLTAQRSIREFILQYQSTHRPAMILTSHYMEDIERLCKRIILIREGRIVYDGQLDNVVKSFATHKILTVHLPERDGAVDRAALERIGTIRELTADLLRIHVPREEAAHAAARIVDMTGAVDLTIEEVDIGTIVESMLRERGGPGE